MTIINQDRGTSLCGQCVVAMLADRPLVDAVSVMGDGRNYPADVRKALKAFGKDFAKSRSTPIENGRPPEGVECAVFAQVPLEDRHAQHWLAWDGRQFFDSIHGCFATLPKGWTGAYYEIIGRPA